MAKQTDLNRTLWKRNREWCYTCQTWVVPIETMGGKTCKTCRRKTDPFPEKVDTNTPK